MLRFTRSIVIAVFAAILTGCGTPGHIDADKLPPVKSVVIADFPDIVPAATIRVTPYKSIGFYFSPNLDPFYSIKDDIGTSLVAARVSTVRPNAVGGLIGGLIDANAQDTEQKAAEFPKLVNEHVKPDLRTELLNALTRSLETKGVSVRVADDTRNKLPRPRWTYKTGEKTILGALPDSASFDADLYVQLAPIAAYVAPGPLNNYSARIAIGVLVYDARTRQYLGSQLFRFEGDAPEFATYGGLVSSVDRVAPLIRSNLLSLAPRVADAIAARRP